MNVCASGKMVYEAKYEPENYLKQLGTYRVCLCKIPMGYKMTAERENAVFKEVIPTQEMKNILACVDAEKSQCPIDVN